MARPANRSVLSRITEPRLTARCRVDLRGRSHAGRALCSKDTGRCPELVPSPDHTIRSRNSSAYCNGARPPFDRCGLPFDVSSERDNPLPNRRPSFRRDNLDHCTRSSWGIRRPRIRFRRRIPYCSRTRFRPRNCFRPRSCRQRRQSCNQNYKRRHRTVCRAVTHSHRHIWGHYIRDRCIWDRCCHYI